LNFCLELKELPSSIGQLNALQELHLNNCFKLEELNLSLHQWDAVLSYIYWPIE
jgi:hypothetical protein